MQLSPGMVYLVGAGPGDPGLLTLKAVDALRQAEVLLYDRLVSPEILELASPAAELIGVGKEGGGICFPQEGIHHLLISHAREGKKVVRLKGGDPFLFGRGGEEALALGDAGIPFEVIPGISSALAVPAAAGIPVTQPGLSSQVTIVTAHTQKDAEAPNWPLLAALGGTLVVLMPLSNLEEITENLIQNGMAPITPAALIHAGTTPQQRSLFAPLNELAPAARQESFTSPALLIIGEVVSLASRIEPDELKGLVDLAEDSLKPTLLRSS
jgi:uroporphyrin-III C-methyltransferase